MIQFIEFRMPLIMSDSSVLRLENKQTRRCVSVELLPSRTEKHYKIAKVQVDVPSLLMYGDYDENVGIGDIPSFLEKICSVIANQVGLSRDCLHHLPSCKVDKLTIGKNVFLGNRDFYREDIPPAECILYNAPNKWVYHIGPKATFLTEFRGQGKKVMRPSDAFAGCDYTKSISIPEGIMSYRFDLTQEQMTRISRHHLLTQLLDEQKLHEVLMEWSKKLPKLPVFDSSDQVIQCIKGSHAPIHTKHRLIRFLRLLLDCGFKKCKRYYSKASFYRHYSDLKKLLRIPAIILAEYNDDDVMFLQPYQTWLAESRQGRGEAELVEALTSVSIRQHY